MEQTSYYPKIRNFWKANDSKIVLVLLFASFLFYAIFVAALLKPGIIPDEPAHFVFSKYFSTSLGIPADVMETYRLGWYIEQNPFLFYWINGRIIDLLELIRPSISDHQLLFSLRLANVLYSLGTIWFCLLISKALIKNKWWQLLPVFLLTHTLMYTFLSGGISYDNLANLFSMAGIYLLIRVLKNRDFLTNSMGWIISIMAGCLVKYTILPLALIMSLSWVVYYFINKEEIHNNLVVNSKKVIVLGIVFLLLFLGNLSIYGLNLITYRKLLPSCSDLLTAEQCSISPYTQRYNEIALDQKITIGESIALGYPDPITYFIDSWIPNMLYRIYGILAHESYFPTQTVTLMRLLFLWLLLIAVRYIKIKDHALLLFSLIGIFVFYAMVLFVTNYNSELVYGFKQIAMQGRYLFPVIGIPYALIAWFLEKTPNKAIKSITIIAIVALFLLSGPIKLIVYYGTIFSSWFVN